MKNIFSFIACILVSIVLLQYRVSYSEIGGDKPIKATSWDALGYYMYLPGIFIYKDVTKLEWLPEIDKKYAMTGGNLYQAGMQENGNYVFKYLGGVALMEAPSFFVGHLVAKHAVYPADGFSQPYQWALSIGALLYCLLAIFLLRKILLIYFSDAATAITILLVCLATNLIQYVAIDACQSHSYLFLLYVLVLYTTIKWHQRTNILWAMLTGYIIGLATMTRPTEAVMIFIPLFWNMHTKEAAKEKWALVKQYRSHIAIAAIAGFIGILPQLIYWKYATGSFVYDVGSKWDFLNPHFRVLFGWEKGWFIYTPITIFFIVGMFFMKNMPFKKSVIWFCLLNIYIVIGWHIWRYGGSYSSRAMMQSYPVFALPFAAITEHIGTKKWRFAFYIVCAYLLCVNLFQINQYNTTILHYDDMNRQYYSRIYLNTHPSPIDMSLLDTHEILENERGYQKIIIADTAMQVHKPNEMPAVLFDDSLTNDKDSWLKIESVIKADNGIWDSHIIATLQVGDSSKQTSIRLYNAISKEGINNKYAFYMYIPKYFEQGHLKISISSPSSFDGTVSKLRITQLEK